MKRYYSVVCRGYDGKEVKFHQYNYDSYLREINEKLRNTDKVVWLKEYAETEYICFGTKKELENEIDNADIDNCYFFHYTDENGRHIAKRGGLFYN